LGVLGHVGLNENCGDVGVESDGEQHCREVERVFAEDARGFGDSQGMQINDAVVDVTGVLSRDPVAQRAEVIAEVHLTSGLDAGEDSSHIATLVEGLSRIRP
jgi:hypothetical protein